MEDNAIKNKSAEQFINWLLEMEYIESADVKDITNDVALIKEAAPRLYNLLKLPIPKMGFVP